MSQGELPSTCGNNRAVGCPSASGAGRRAALARIPSSLNELHPTREGLQIHFPSQQLVMESFGLQNSPFFYLQSLKALGSKEIAYLG